MPSEMTSETALTTADAIKILALDATLQVSDDIDSLLSPHIPENLPHGVWHDLMDEFRTDLQKTVEMRVQWLLQSAYAEAKEIQFQQRIQAQMQAEFEQTTIQAQIQETGTQAIQAKVLSAPQDAPIRSKVNPPIPKERPVITPIPTSRPSQSRRIELQPDPYAYAPQSPDPSKPEDAPRRKRRRSGIFQTA
ncbi:MAG: hypothetical protein WCD18_27500 [Thermosynechococcaceae cyanobacterium]